MYFRIKKKKTRKWNKIYQQIRKNEKKLDGGIFASKEGQKMEQNVSIRKKK